MWHELASVGEAIEAAARVIREADALLVTAGAGMGVDSGLPDFRGTDGFWRAYPAFATLGLQFEELANPRWFAQDPALAWGFYGHRLNLYRQTVPHDGFRMLLDWGRAKPGGAFVFTSNVDGQFQRAGFNVDRVVECHGSIHHLQCSRPCGEEIWPNECAVAVDPTTLRADGERPRCPACGAVARPNVLMFGDGSWLERRTEQQWRRYEAWLAEWGGGGLAVVEFGAGEGVPTVRMESERAARRHRGTLVRINPRDTRIPAGAVAIAGTALETLRRLDPLVRDPAK